MQGQLWQECFCGREPVCCTCEKCQKHCRCGEVKVLIPVFTAFEPYRKGIGQGFGDTEDGQ